MENKQHKRYSKHRIGGGVEMNEVFINALVSRIKSEPNKMTIEQVPIPYRELVQEKIDSGGMTYMNEIIVAIIAFAGTAVGTLGGIMASSRLTNHRLQQLEKKVDKHNTVIERTYILEEKVKVITTDLMIWRVKR